MFNKSVEKTISQFFLIGLPFVTLFILWGTVTDPVNITKLFMAGCLAFGVFAIALTYGMKELWRTSKALVIVSVLFVAAMLNAVLNSNSSTNQNIYGVFGRQTGFVTYLCLALIALSAALLRRRRSFEYIVWALLFSGVVNILYCAWALVFGDFIGWNNPYGNILGLFGNPNFIGAFLGIFISASIAVAINSLQTVIRVLIKKNKSASDVVPTFLSVASIPVLAILSIIALYEIKRSHAVQGLVVTGAGLAIIGFYVIRGLSKGAIPGLIYTIFVAIIGGFALGGALQKGPLASLIYKRSVSLRGTYWETGINIGKEHPWTGVGLDSYGDWYRALRPDRALKDMPGVATITNAAHNVVIDFFANGGFPLLISYLAILVVGAISVIRVTLRNRKFDGIFVALTVAWATYQLQSIISINQVGLAVWGWVLTGALVAYEYSTREVVEETGKKRQSKQKELIFSAPLVGGIGIVIGALIAVPPLSGDSKWREAVKSLDAQKVQAALTPSYLTPEDSYKYGEAIQLFERSKLYDLAYTYAIKATEFNPNYFDAWKMLYAISKSTPADKERALANMKRLDPKNPDVLAQ
jgi:O-antigen ligase